MINLIIKNARKAQDVTRYPHSWLALHPDNDAVLAICDTETEVNGVIESFSDLASLIEDDPSTVMS